LLQIKSKQEVLQLFNCKIVALLKVNNNSEFLISFKYQDKRELIGFGLIRDID